MVEGENQHPQVILWPPPALWDMCKDTRMHIDTHTYAKKIIFEVNGTSKAESGLAGWAEVST